MTTEYLLDSGTDLAAEQLGYLEGLLDESSHQFIAEVTARPGQRCLDLGSGSGSMARWLAERVRPGEVVAADLDSHNLCVPPDVKVSLGDINHRLPDGPFDVIHARLLLMHLSRRREILAELVDALAPGGWLILGEQVFRGQRVISAPSEIDVGLVGSIITTTIDKVGRPGGIDYEWGDQIDDELVAAGLRNVDSIEISRTTRGGEAGCRLLSNYVRQVEGPLRCIGVTDDQLARFHELMLDPRVRTWYFPFLCARGRKPAG